jgi:hypothetical protein
MATSYVVTKKLVDSNGAIITGKDHTSSGNKLKLRPFDADDSTHDIDTLELASTGYYVPYDGTYGTPTITVLNNKLPRMKYKYIYPAAAVTVVGSPLDLRVSLQELTIIGNAESTTDYSKPAAEGNAYRCISSDSSTYTNFTDINGDALVANEGDLLYYNGVSWEKMIGVFQSVAGK